MTSVYTINTEEDSFVQKLKKELYEADHNQNTDLHIQFKGYLHNKTGFQLRIENIEVFNDELIETWKNIVSNHGLNCDITADLSNAWVLLKCRRILRHRKSLRDRFSIPLMKLKMPSVPFTLLGYLLIIVACIYIIWSRNKEKFQS